MLGIQTDSISQDPSSKEIHINIDPEKADTKELNNQMNKIIETLGSPKLLSSTAFLVSKEQNLFWGTYLIFHYIQLFVFCLVSLTKQLEADTLLHIEYNRNLFQLQGCKKQGCLGSTL